MTRVISANEGARSLSDSAVHCEHRDIHCQVDPLLYSCYIALLRPAASQLYFLVAIGYRRQIARGDERNDRKQKHMKRLLTAILSGVLSFVTVTAMAADPVAGKAAAGLCISCHGVDGNSVNPVWPKLAGQHEAYLIKQMKDFKSGARSDPVMSAMSKSITDANIENIAAYFASQTPQ